MHIVFLYDLIPVFGSVLISTRRITPFKKIIFVTAIIIQCIKMRPRLVYYYMVVSEIQVHEEEDKGSSIFKIRLLPRKLRSKMWFHDCRRKMYARNTICTLCGTKILFKQIVFSKTSCIVLIIFGCHFKYPEYIYRYPSPPKIFTFYNILDVS